MDHRHSPERRTRTKLALFLGSFVVLFGALIGFFMWRGSVDVFSPVGTIGRQQRDLIVLASLLSLLVVVPVFTLLFTIAWRYRETNTRATYRPDWDGNRIAEFVWWTIPIILISILATIMWKYTHSLDPSKPIASSHKPITIQVVALEWRWLFIYPEQHVASLDYLEFPVATPVHFEITADAPMNSFWIPKLGGQIYAMNGMSTELNLIADRSGAYRGSSANLSGSGFSNMDFVARATTAADFQAWVRSGSQSAPLTTTTYNALAKPSTSKETPQYSLGKTDIYDYVIDKYMHPSEGTE